MLQKQAEGLLIRFGEEKPMQVNKEIISSSQK